MLQGNSEVVLNRGDTDNFGWSEVSPYFCCKNPVTITLSLQSESKRSPPFALMSRVMSFPHVLSGNPRATGLDSR